MTMRAIHAAVKAALDAKTYTGNIVPNNTTTATVVVGGTSGVAIPYSVYDWGFKFIRVSDTTINVYSHTGSDQQAGDAGTGAMRMRTFDIPTQTMNNDGIEFQLDDTYYIQEHHPVVLGGSIYIYLVELLRAEVNVVANRRVRMIKSTDGLVGRSFGAPINLTQGDPNEAALKNASVIHEIYNGNADGSIKYLNRGSGSPAGLRRQTVGPDGVLSDTTLINAASGYSEGSTLNLDNTGRVLDINRINTGAKLQQCYSADWGASWSPLVDTNIGAATGAKVTPSMCKSASRGDRVTVFFNDRGDSSRDVISALNPIDAVGVASAPAWNPTTYLGAVGTQGNGAGCVADRKKGTYLYCVADEIVSGETTRMLYWVAKDNYTTKQVQPAPWR